MVMSHQHTTTDRPASTIFLPDILLVEDLAPVLRMSPSGVRAALRAGRIPGKRVGRKWMVSRAALLGFIASTGRQLVCLTGGRA